MCLLIFFISRVLKPLRNIWEIRRPILPVRLLKRGNIQVVKAYFTGDLKKITECYVKYDHCLAVEKDPATYAKKLTACMTTAK